MRTYITHHNDMLDWLCWKVYKHQSRAVEAVLEANPGLADYGERFPAGVEIVLPELSFPITNTPIRLWD